MQQVRSCVLIDDMGRLHPWPGSRLAIELGHDGADFDVLDYVVRNLGYIVVVETSGFIRVALRPLFAGFQSVGALEHFVDERQPRRMALSYFDYEWHHEVCGDVHALRRRLHEVLNAGLKELPGHAYLASRRNIDAILRDGRSPFTPLLRRWFDGECPDDVPSFLRSCGLLERAMIAERCPESGDFVFVHSGQRIELYDRSWSVAAAGRKVHDQPDRIYGRWIAETCRAVDERQMPRYELVHAKVDEPGKSPRHWRYERLVLPWRQGDRRIVVSVSIRD